jgi:hypothetical protein
MIPFRLLVERQISHWVAKGKRQFKNRIITEKGKKFPLVKVELAPDGFLELTLKWNSFKGERKVLPSTFVRFILFVLLNNYKEKCLLEEGRRTFLFFKGEAPQEFFAGIEKLLSGIPPHLKRIQFRKLLREG